MYHQIEQRETKNKAEDTPKSSDVAKPKLLIEEICKEVSGDERHFHIDASPKFAFASTRDSVKVVLARIPIRENVQDFSLAVFDGKGICVKSHEGQEVINVTFPCAVNSENSRAVFNKHSKILTVILPLA